MASPSFGIGFGDANTFGGQPISFDRNILQGLDASTPFTASPQDPIDLLAASAGNDLINTNARLAGAGRSLNDIEKRVGEGDAVADARENARRGSEVDAGIFERQTRGQDLSARQKAAAKKRIGLTRAISQADATGSVRREFSNSQQAVRRVSGSLSDALFEQRLSSETDAAAAAGQKDAANAQRSAAKKSSVLGAIGSVAGAVLPLLFMSSEAVKDNHGHEGQLLSKLKKVRVNRWNYKGDTEEHVGPFSEEFNREFGIKTKHPNMINVIDALGITLGAVKELNEKVDRNGV